MSFLHELLTGLKQCFLVDAVSEDADVGLWRVSESLTRGLVFFLFWRLRNVTAFWWLREVWQAVQHNSNVAEDVCKQFCSVFVETYIVWHGLPMRVRCQIHCVSILLAYRILFADVMSYV